MALIVIDYLQLITPSHSIRSAPRYQEIAHIMRNPKMMAKELRLAVLVLLHRGFDQLLGAVRKY